MASIIESMTSWNMKFEMRASNFKILIQSAHGHWARSKKKFENLKIWNFWPKWIMGATTSACFGAKKRSTNGDHNSFFRKMRAKRYCRKESIKPSAIEELIQSTRKSQILPDTVKVEPAILVRIIVEHVLLIMMYFVDDSWYHLHHCIHYLLSQGTEVSQLMEVEVINGKRPGEYYVVWSDGSKSWEPEENLVGCQSLVCLFEELLTEFSGFYLRRHIRTKEDMLKLAEKRLQFISQTQLDCSISKTKAKRTPLPIREYIVID